MKSYKTTMRVRHDGKSYLVGELIDLDADTAKELLALKAIINAPAKAAKKTVPAKKTVSKD